MTYESRYVKTGCFTTELPYLSVMEMSACQLVSLSACSTALMYFLLQNMTSTKVTPFDGLLFVLLVTEHFGSSEILTVSYIDVPILDVFSKVAFAIYNGSSKMK